MLEPTSLLRRTALRPSTTQQLSPHLALAEQAAMQACERARRVDYRPGSQEMAALQRAERVLQVLKAAT